MQASNEVGLRGECCCYGCYGCICLHWPELEGAGIHKMKMLQKMRLLEEKGSSFANTPIKDLQVFGEQHGPAWQRDMWLA